MGHRIDLRSGLSFRSAFSFPLQSSQARREILIGGLLLLIPFIGWMLNMGHRIMMVHRMQHGRDAWPAWTDWKALLRHGAITFAGMIYYYSPGAVLAAIAYWQGLRWLYPIAGVLLLSATIAIPGYMSHYCRVFDVREIFNPVRALGRVVQGGTGYFRAWAIALCALALSLVGLLALGVGFLFTSVWFWQVAGFGFATVFTNRFRLDTPPDDASSAHGS
jgi:hypothetical protein